MFLKINALKLFRRKSYFRIILRFIYNHWKNLFELKRNTENIDITDRKI